MRKFYAILASLIVVATYFLVLPSSAFASVLGTFPVQATSTSFFQWPCQIGSVSKSAIVSATSSYRWITADGNTGASACKIIYPSFLPQLVDGSYYLIEVATSTNIDSSYLDLSSIDYYKADFTISGGVCTNCSDITNYGRTRIISFTPEEGSTTASTSVSFSLHAYINPDDIGDVIGVRLVLHNINQNAMSYIPFYQAFDPNDIFLFEGSATSSGDFYFASTTHLDLGNYRVEAVIGRTYVSGFVQNPFSSINDDQSHQFIVGSSTVMGIISQTGFDTFNGFLGGYTSSTTSSFGDNCTPWSSNFAISGCLAYLFIPDSYHLNQTMTNLRNGFLVRFPMGYATRFYDIMATSSTTTIPIFSVTVPTGMIGAGASLSLNLNGVLDNVLNSTTSWTGSGINNTITLKEYTMSYWEKIVYILLAFYIMSRLFGSHLFSIDIGGKAKTEAKFLSGLESAKYRQYRKEFDKVVKK